MLDRRTPLLSRNEKDLKEEVARLEKIVQALMDRAERSTCAQGSDFSLFQTAVTLEEQVSKRTAELEAALRENEAVNRALRESEAKFRGLVDQSLVGIVMIKNGRFTYSNARFNELFGYTAEEIRELGLLDLVTENYRPIVAENNRKRLSGEVVRIDYMFRGLRKNRAVIDVEVHSSMMEISGEMALISMLIDVTERTRVLREMQALQDKLRDQSTRDALTGLYNRRYLDETLDRELILAVRHSHPVSVIISDVDHFKAVNDRYGHSAGDEVLRVFSGLLKQHARGSDICCRYGGEEFLVVLPRMSQDIAIERAELLRSAFAAAPVPWDGTQLTVTASFGVAAFPHAGRTANELVAAADRALYAAKAAGRNRIEVDSVRLPAV